MSVAAACLIISASMVVWSLMLNAQGVARALRNIQVNGPAAVRYRRERKHAQRDLSTYTQVQGRTVRWVIRRTPVFSCSDVQGGGVSLTLLWWKSLKDCGKPIPRDLHCVLTRDGLVWRAVRIDGNRLDLQVTFPYDFVPVAHNEPAEPKAGRYEVRWWLGRRCVGRMVFRISADHEPAPA